MVRTYGNDGDSDRHDVIMISQSGNIDFTGKFALYGVWKWYNSKGFNYDFYAL